nr:serine/threonine-protein kinase [Streptomonospora alba]
MPEPAPLTDDDPAEIGGYRLLGRLGKGGQGTVYLARSAQGGPYVAVKRLSAEALEDPRVRRRFIREADAARQVASFCTAAVLAVDFDAQTPYIVSEYVEGRSLSQLLRQDGPMGGGDLGRLAVATATALVAIHEAGIVHRDFKPGNVLLGDGGARVIDFGIAQMTEGTGTLTDSSIGTPSFMAPEQIAHGNVTPASDVFAWGSVMVCAATGASPFDGGTVPNVLHNVLYAQPDLRALPETLRPLIAAALAKNPAARPTAVDVLMALLGRQGRPSDAAGLSQAMREAHTAVSHGGGSATVAGGPHTPTTAPATDAVGPPRQGKRRSRWLLGAGAVVAAVALVGTGVLLGNALGPNGAEGGEEGTGGNSGGEAASADADGGDAAGNDAGGDDASGSSEGGGVASDDQRFSEEEAGTWEGVTDAGTRFEAHIEAGKPAADLESLDDEACSTTIRLLGKNDDGDAYRAHIAFTGMDEGASSLSCVSGEEWDWSDEVDLTITGAGMTIDFFDEYAWGEKVPGAKSTLALTRTD